MLPVPGLCNFLQAYKALVHRSTVPKPMVTFLYPQHWEEQTTSSELKEVCIAFFVRLLVSFSIYQATSSAGSGWAEDDNSEIYDFEVRGNGMY